MKDLLEGQIAANSFINLHPAQAQQIVNDQFTVLAGKPLAQSVLTAAWKNITFTDDPIASSWLVDARHASAVGLSVGTCR